MANEKRLIDANALVDDTYILNSWDVEIVRAWLDDQPTVDAEEVVHGRWVDRWGGKYANPHYECSKCKKSAPYKCKRDVLDNGLWVQDLTNYCPHCGAKMDGGNEDV